MRVHLAFQITSQTTLKMLSNKRLLAKCHMNEELVGPMKKVIAAMDEMIDIMNATSIHNGVPKNGRIINKPTYKHIMKLLNILKLFTTWKQEPGSKKENFITSESYDDLVWMVYAVVGVATHYLDEDGKKTMDQGRSGSDVLENHFSNNRTKYSSASLHNCNVGTANAQASRTHTFSTKTGTNHSGTRKETQVEIFSEIQRKKK